MPCTQTLAGIVRDCAPSRGGVAEVLIANHADVSAVTVSQNNTISSITMASSAKFKKYACAPETAELAQTPQIDPANGVNFVQSVLSMVFHRQDTAKRIEMNALSLGDLAVIVKDMNGKYWYLGYDEPVRATTGDSGSGKARTDANRYGISLTDNSLLYPFEVEADAIEDII